MAKVTEKKSKEIKILVEKSLFESIESYCKENNYTMSFLIRNLLLKFLLKENNLDVYKSQD